MTPRERETHVNKSTARKLRMVLSTDGKPRQTQGERPLLVLRHGAAEQKVKRLETIPGMGRRLPRHSMPERLQPGEKLAAYQGVWPGKGSVRARKRAWAGLSHVQRKLLLADREALVEWATRIDMEATPKAELVEAWKRARPSEEPPRSRAALVIQLLETKAA